MRPSAVHGPFAGRTWLVTSVPLPPSRVNVLAGLRSFEARMATLVPEQRERRGRRRRPAPPPRVSSLRRMRGTQSEADLREARSRPDSPASAYSEDQARCSTIASIDRILSSMHSLLDAGGGPEAPLPPPALPETIPEEPDVPPQPPLRQLPQLDSQMSLDEMFTEIETLYDSLRNQNAKGAGGAAGSEPYTSNVTQDPIGAESRLDRSAASHRARSVPADVQRSQSLTAGSRSRRGATLSPQVCRQGGARRSASARTCRPPAPLPPPAAEHEVQYDVPRWPQPVPVHVRGPSAPAALPSRPVTGRRSPPEEVVYDTPRPVGGRPPLPLPLEPALPPRAATLPSPPLPPPPPPPLLLETFSSLPGKQAAAVKPKPAIPVPRPPELPPHRQKRVRSPSARSRRSPSPSQGTPPVPAHGGAPESPRPAVPRRLDSTARLLEGLTAPLPPPRPESPAGHLSAARRRAVALLLDDQLLLPAAPSHDPAHGPPARRTPRLGRSATAAAGSAAHGRRRRLDTPPSEGERERSPAAVSRGTTAEQHSELCNGAPSAQQNCHDSDLDHPPTPPPRDAPPAATSSRGVSPSPNTTLNTTQDTIGSGSTLSPAPPISTVLETLTREAADNVRHLPTASAVQPPERPGPAPAGVVTPMEGKEDGQSPVSVSERAEKLRQQLAIRQPAADGAVHRSPGGSAREEGRRHGDHCAVM
ncbi:hypothetical protein FJT64_021883 [Amphibalanus amphitrite]|uniref:Uncharacterized protein n=1 Tax=Amphibalanus amphitrite TaxID=1232801 RepID=A0A6A4WGS3_AMPAM|nr:hypothetical protein FJT64_021883 [Amphibalanus amphitrite]